MYNQLSIKSYLKFIFFTFTITGSTVAGLPTQAATFQTEGLFSISQLSHVPQFTKINDNRKLELKSSPTSLALGRLTGDAIFFNQPSFDLECSSSIFTQELSTPAACITSSSQVEVQGTDYFALAKNNPSALGSFNIASGETLSFDFTAFLALQTQADDLKEKSFGTFGAISLELYTLAGNGELNLLDSFAISGNLDSPGKNDFLLTSQASENLNIFKSDRATNFGDSEEFAAALVQGSYARFFDTDTTAIVVVSNKNQIAIIPESSSRLTLLMFGFFGSVAIALRFKKNESK